MCSVFAPFFFASLVIGQEISTVGCHIVGLLTYGIVIATLCGPVIVAWISYWFFRGVIVTSSEPELSKVALVLILAAPWVLGVLLGLIALNTDELGSYRGLYCYTKNWRGGIAGVATITCLVGSSLMTTIAYWKTFRMVSGSRSKVSASNDKNDSIVILIKGAKLVASLFGCWGLFSITGFMSTAGLDAPVQMEAVGACVIFVQPMIDYVILLKTFDWKNGPAGAGTANSTREKMKAREANRVKRQETRRLQRGTKKAGVVVPLEQKKVVVKSQEEQSSAAPLTGSMSNDNLTGVVVG